LKLIEVILHLSVRKLIFNIMNRILANTNNESSKNFSLMFSFSEQIFFIEYSINGYRKVYLFLKNALKNNNSIILYTKNLMKVFVEFQYFRQKFKLKKFNYTLSYYYSKLHFPIVESIIPVFIIY